MQFKKTRYFCTLLIFSQIFASDQFSNIPGQLNLNQPFSPILPDSNTGGNATTTNDDENADNITDTEPNKQQTRTIVTSSSYTPYNNGINNNGNGIINHPPPESNSNNKGKGPASSQPPEGTKLFTQRNNSTVITVAKDQSQNAELKTGTISGSDHPGLKLFCQWPVIVMWPILFFCTLGSIIAIIVAILTEIYDF